jgi:hypothetical protein
MRGSVAALVAVAAWLTALGGGARAEADDEDALIRRGVELRKRGDDRAALQELQRAYQVAKSPRAAAQLGFAEQALALWPQAETHVSESLRAEADPWITKNRAVVEEALRTIRSHVGRIEISGGRPGASVAVNGQRVGTLPLAQPVAVSSGPVDVEVKAAGYLPAVKTVHVAAGEYARLSFALVAQQPPPFTPAPAPRGPTVLPSVPVIATGAVPPDASAETDAGRGRRVAAIGIGAAGVVAIGAGIACSVVGRNKFNAINDDAAADRPYNESNGNWKTYETSAVALYVAGGAALVTGSVLYLTSRRGEARGGAISLRPVVAPSRAGALVSVSF